MALAESEANIRARLTEAAAASRVADAEAAVAYQQAEGLALQNRAQRQRSEEAARGAAKQRSVVKPVSNPALARRAAPRAIDAQTGEIAWPAPLLETDFDAPREKLNALGGLGDRSTAEIARRKAVVNAVVTEMKAQLKDKIHEMPAPEYMAASRFLDALKTQLPAGAVEQRLAMAAP